MESTIATALSYIEAARETENPERTLRQMCKGIASLCTVVGLDGLPCADLEQRRGACITPHFDRRGLHAELDNQLCLEMNHRTVKGLWVYLVQRKQLVNHIYEMLKEE